MKSSSTTLSDLADKFTGLPATARRYSSAIIMLHWTTLVLVLVAVALALYRDYILIPTNDPRTATIMSLHMSFGLIVWLLTIARFFVRATSTVPASVASSPLMLIAERSMHYLLYAFLFVVPLIGLASAWVRGRPFMFFGIIPISSPLTTDWKSPTGKLLEVIHMDFAYAFFILAGLHAFAAIYHHIVRREPVLRRILPSTR